MSESRPDKIPACLYRVGQRVTRYSELTWETDAVVWDIRDLGDICVVVLRFKNGIIEEFKTRKV